MKLQYLFAPEMNARLLEDSITYLLSGFVPAPGQLLISTDQLVELARNSLNPKQIEEIKLSRIQVEL
ncbi:hypothetical protein Q0M94_19890 (plasmid) [Deinococcus radiomollis]|uniref:hypothetical protein n=1 Tax=Deinococcus radiomollis TaxID=468916 RepID=UPI003891F5E7